MNAPNVVIAQEDDRERVNETLVLGFSSDPFARWLCPGVSMHMQQAQMFNHVTECAIDAGSAYIAGGYQGVALWLPPGVAPDENDFAATVRAVVPGEVVDDALGVFAAMEENHPKEPCWYLSLIAADPIYQGKGIGAQLMKHGLQRVDEDGLPAYLESSNARNMSLYERNGFKLTGQLQVGTSPIIYTMWREAR